MERPSGNQAPARQAAKIRRGVAAMPEQGRRRKLHLVEASAAPPDCGTCPYREQVLAAGRCVPGDICLIAHSGRQIDRFLRRNPEYAESCLADAFWERRAIAVRHAPLERIVELVHDTDEVVRRAVAIRLPADDLAMLRNDPDREVRITVAARIPVEQLEKMMGDPDYLVRQHVAERLPHGRLPRMVDDPDREVRKAVARRLPAFALKRMATDAEAEVRRIVASRLFPNDAALLLADPDWLVRLEAARRAPVEAIADLVDDPEPDVRALVRARLETFLKQEEAP
ncbi:MAG: 4Fe4S-binding leucine-rich repeat protein [Gallionellaceae bacterium]|nr:4Fe4S-binding leucine-rich repeat protein [Gallionellaceae bacterium]